MAGSILGTRVLRTEDPELLTGAGRFVDDLLLHDPLHVVFVRSEMAHARLLEVHSEQARAMPGVVAVLTAADLARVMTGPMQIMGPPALKVPQYHPLATDKVRLVGDLQTELVHDFFEGFATGARGNVHIKVMYGRSNHHKIEASFKAFARALRVAVAKDKRMAKMLPSTKGLM